MSIYFFYTHITLHMNMQIWINLVINNNLEKQCVKSMIDIMTLMRYLKIIGTCIEICWICFTMVFTENSDIYIYILEWNEEHGGSFYKPDIPTIEKIPNPINPSVFNPSTIPFESIISGRTVTKDILINPPQLKGIIHEV